MQGPAALVKLSKNSIFFLFLLCIATSLIIVGELGGDFSQIRQLSSKSQDFLIIPKGEFASLNNSVFFGFTIDNGEDILMVKLATNQTFSWYEPIESGKRIFRNEKFMLNETDCSFEIDVTVKFYDRQALQIIDNTKSTS